MYSHSSRIVSISQKIINKTLLSDHNAVKLRIKYTFSQRANFHSNRNKHRTKVNISYQSNNNNLINDKQKFNFNSINSLITFRNFTSSSTDEAFRRFRSFKNGEQFTKRFIDSTLQYTVSVAYSPKDRLQKNVSNDDGVYDEGEFVQNFKLLNANNVFESPTGEDNYILAYTEIGIIIGVLDGVGGWSEQGFDSSAISRELANKITYLYLNNPNQKPLTILNDAFDLVKSEGNVKVGSTTICFGIIDGKSGNLNALNLGDSWFGVFRKDKDTLKYKCVKQSNEQIYYFNAPYQLSIIPEKFLEDAKKRGSKYLMNEPNESDNYSFGLESGDIVIFTTDGMIDNIFPDDIELYLNDTANDEVNLSETLGGLNKVLVQQTTVLSLNTNFKSAFSQKLTELAGQDYIGGKPDDITSVMVYIK